MFKTLKALRKDTGGATIIEFAIVAPVLFLLMFGMIEFGIMMATQSALDGAVSQAARDYKAESRQGNNRANPGAIRNRIRNNASALLGGGTLRVTARVIQWGNAQNMGSNPSSNSGRAGTNGQVIQYRAYYWYDIKTPIMANILGNTLVLPASTVIQNEPTIGGGGGI
jgi:Flp pilus assembly protein TadG